MFHFRSRILPGSAEKAAGISHCLLEETPRVLKGWVKWGEEKTKAQMFLQGCIFRVNSLCSLWPAELMSRRGRKTLELSARTEHCLYSV